ncbi:MAG: hypothetical protein ACFUZC_10705 [Chthoniobacteraceae bacterium]
MQNALLKKPLSLAPVFGTSHWGLMFHYIDSPASSSMISTTSSKDWNRRVDSFDVAAFVEQVKESGAGHIIFTLGQNSGHYCAPNPVYDDLTGITESRLSQRDLIDEIATALAPEVKVIAYSPSHAPAHHQEAVRALKCMPPWDCGAWGLQHFWTNEESADERLSEFQRHWEDILRYWGLKWGEKISGWWIDGCYYHPQLYSGETEPNFKTFAQALRAGNPERILAFNSGTDKPFVRLTKEQDYTAGEVSDVFPVHSKGMSLQEQAEGQQLHILSYLGSWWGEGSPRFDDQFACGYTRQLIRSGGALTWDVPIELNGNIPSDFREQLKRMRSSICA